MSWLDPSDGPAEGGGRPRAGPPSGRRSPARTRTPARTLSIDVDDIAPDLDIDDRLGALWRSARLGPTVERLRRRILQEGPRSIEAAQFRALDAIASNQPCAVRDLAAVMALDASTVTRVTQRLEEAGLVRKTRASHDKRQVLLELTDEGAETHEYFVDRAHAIYRQVFTVFTPEERILLSDLLERMLKSTDTVLGRP